jgi:hypothetical protein
MTTAEVVQGDRLVGKPVSLVSEWQLLVYLVHNTGKVLPKGVVAEDDLNSVANLPHASRIVHTCFNVAIKTMSDFSVVDSAETTDDHEEMVAIGRCGSSNWACRERVRAEVERELNRTRQSKVGCRGSN